MGISRRSWPTSRRPSSRPVPPYGRRRQREHLDEAATLGTRGGRVERRHPAAAPILNDYLDWPGVAQVGRLERTVDRGEEATHEVASFIASVPRGRAGAATPLSRHRGPWGIENRLHYVRDVSFGEDANRAGAGSGPRVPAARRNAAISHLRLRGAANIAAALRRNAARVRDLLVSSCILKN